MRVKSIISKISRNIMLLLSAALVFACCYFAPMKVSAKDGVAVYINNVTGYSAVILDNANYIDDLKEDELLQIMIPITEYSNVVYLTDEGNYSYTESYSEDLSRRTAYALFDNNRTDKVNVIVYECDNEYDYIFSNGKVHSSPITSAKAYSITDNIYKYSADGNYYKAAEKAFTQIYNLLEGKAIAEPMKYICNAIMAITIALLINFLIINSKSKLKRASSAELISGAISWVETTPPMVEFISESKTYSPQSSGGGGGHGGHGGGGHGGGGHGGGGGGHSH